MIKTFMKNFAVGFLCVICPMVVLLGTAFLVAVEPLIGIPVMVIAGSIVSGYLLTATHE